jgi:hypothetical protein
LPFIGVLLVGDDAGETEVLDCVLTVDAGLASVYVGCPHIEEGKDEVE